MNIFEYHNSIQKNHRQLSSSLDDIEYPEKVYRLMLLIMQVDNGPAFEFHQEDYERARCTSLS